MNAILAIAALIAAVTAREIVQAVAAHLKAKDALKALKAIQETSEAREREAGYKLAASKSEESAEKSKELAEKYRKEAADINRKKEEVKAELADKIAAMTLEQLAAYNRTLDESSRPPVRYMPVYLPYYGYPTPYYSPTQWRGW